MRALLAAVLLAGCATPLATTTPLDGLAATAPAFLPALAMDQPTGGAEPNMAILPDGTIFITAVAGSQERPNAAEGAAWLWRSNDGGASWETLREPVRETPLGSLPNTRRPFGSSDADVVASPDGWVYYSDWWNWGTPAFASAPEVGTFPPRAGNYLVEASGDGGATWSRASVTIPDATSVDRQWLVAGEDGLVVLVYAYFEPVANAPARVTGEDGVMRIKAVRSTDHGATWSRDAATVVAPEPGWGYQIAHPTRLPDGTMSETEGSGQAPCPRHGCLAMPYGAISPGDDFWTSPSEVRLALSADAGTTWESRKVADVPEGFDNLWAVQGAADDAGALHVAWAARTGANMTVFLASSPDLSSTWSEPRPLRSEGLNFLPWVAARGDGHVAVGWYGSDATGDPTEAADDVAWYAYVAELAPDREPVATRVSDDPVKTGPLCPKGAACTSDRELLDYVSLEYDADGRLHYAFARSREVAGAKAGLVHYAGERVDEVA